MRTRTIALCITIALAATGCVAESGDGDAAPSEERAPIGAEFTTWEFQPPRDQPVAHDAIVGTTIDDLNAFWAETFPAVYGDEYFPVSTVVGISPGGALPNDDCAPDMVENPTREYETYAGNAFYCWYHDTVIYDDVGYFGGRHETYGDAPIALSLAHEWGHAIQARSGMDLDEHTVMLVELQADCLSGAWLAHVRAGASSVSLDAAAIDTALFGRAFGRRPPDLPAELDWHGTTFDRLRAIKDGVDHGAARCAEYVDDPPTVVLTDWAGDQAREQGGDLPLDQLVDLSTRALNAYWTDRAPGFVPIESVTGHDPASLAPCGGGAVAAADLANRFWFCTPSNSVLFDQSLAERLLADVGDFAVAGYLSLMWTWALANQGFTAGSDGGPHLLESDCLRGTWIAALAFQDPALADILYISPGDIDEELTTLLWELESRRAEDPTFTSTGFDRLQAYGDGFFAVDGGERDPIGFCAMHRDT